jgi:hypothetical protein
LWVECDFVKYWDEPYDANNPIPISTPIPLPSPENYLGHSIQELEKACVKIELYDNPRPSPVYPSHNPMRAEEEYYRDIIPFDKTIFPNIPDETGRDLPAESTPEFWTVRILMAPNYYEVVRGPDGKVLRDNNGNAITRLTTATGAFESGIDTIVLNYHILSELVSTWNAKPENANKQVTLENRIARTLLHELCHVLIDDRENYVFFAGGAFYNEVQKPYDEESISLFGVRDTFAIVTLDENNEVQITSDDYRFVMYRWLKERDVREIQEHSMADN